MFKFWKKTKPKIEKCSKCDKPVHRIDDWFGGGPGIQDYGEPLKSEYCIDHLIEQKPEKFNDEVKGYAKAVNKWQENQNKSIQKALKEKKPVKNAKKPIKKKTKK